MFVIFGLVLYAYGRRYGGTGPEVISGSWTQPPRWARLLLGSRKGRILVNDALIELIGLAWAVGGALLWLAGWSPGSRGYLLVVGALLAILIGGGLGALAVFVRRELLRR
jgi:hypothetical protein